MTRHTPEGEGEEMVSSVADIAVRGAVAPASREASAKLDREELTDLISDAISDSMEMDWSSRDGARSVVDALVEEGVVRLDGEPVRQDAWPIERAAMRPFLALAREVMDPTEGREWLKDSKDWTVVFSFAGVGITLGDLRRLASLAESR